MDQKPSERIYEIENENTPSWEFNRLAEDEILHRRINAIIQFLDEVFEEKKDDNNNTTPKNN